MPPQECRVSEVSDFNTCFSSSGFEKQVCVGRSVGCQSGVALNLEQGVGPTPYPTP